MKPNLRPSLFRNRRPQRPEKCASLAIEIVQGMAIGCIASALIALGLGGHPDSAVTVFAMLLGTCLGFGIGLALWIGDVELPEVPIPLPPPGQRRADDCAD